MILVAIAKRAIFAFSVLLLVAVSVFLVTRLVGDPVRGIVGVDATAEQYRSVARELGYDRPLTTQLLAYLREMTTLDIGTSTWQGRPNAEVIQQTLPITVQLSVLALLGAAVVGIPLGVRAAMNPGGRLDWALRFVSLTVLSTPPFFLGLILIIVLAVQLDWFPTQGQTGLSSAVLPLLTLALPTCGRLALVVREAMERELSKPWIRTARALGLAEREVVWIQALRNAGAETVTFSGWELIRMITGYTIVVELVFAWPGLGYTALQAVERQDLPLIQAAVVVIAAMVLVVNAATDLACSAIDRRVRPS